MLSIICRFIIASANISALTSCTEKLWGEEEMPEVLKKKHQD